MFTDYFFPELGGIQDSIATVSRALGRRGHLVDIYAPRYGRRDYGRIGSAVGERDLGGNVRVRRRASLPFPSSTRQSRAALPSPFGWTALATRARPDVIHAHSFFGVGLEALAAGGWLSIPVIGTNHTTVTGFAPYIPFGAQRANAYVAWFYNRCDHITAPSRSVFEEMGACRLARPRTTVSNPIDTTLFRPPRDDERDTLRERFALSGQTITYAGRLGPEKNIEPLLRAVAALRDRGVFADLVIAGHGSHEAALRALAASLRITPQVRFLGTLAQDALADLLRASDIFCIMSTSETQSMVMLQAMASGVPVVAADTRALPEYVDADNGVLVDPRDFAGLAQAFADLLAAPDRRRRLGMAGRQRAERYNVEAVTDQWEALYQSVRQGSNAA